MSMLGRESWREVGENEDYEEEPVEGAHYKYVRDHPQGLGFKIL